MLGNLSKSLIKAPHYFNINVDSEPNQYTKIAQENLLDTYSNLRRINSRNSTRYFKERDFVKKNLKIDLNYNNNFRKEIIPSVRTKPCMSFEEFMFGNNTNTTSKSVTKQSLYKTNKTNKTNITNLTNNTNKTNKTNKTSIPNKPKNSDLIFSPISTYKKAEYQNFLEKTLILRDSVKDFDGKVKSKMYDLMDKINHSSFRLDDKFDPNKKNKIESLKELINKDTVIKTPMKLKFPEIFIKSQETLYREAMDKKISSLSMLSPKIKDQLKSKNRRFASEKDFYRYNNSYAKYQLNPFYESVKYMEEINKDEII